MVRFDDTKCAKSYDYRTCFGFFKPIQWMCCNDRLHCNHFPRGRILHVAEQLSSDCGNYSSSWHNNCDQSGWSSWTKSNFIHLFIQKNCESFWLAFFSLQFLFAVSNVGTAIGLTTLGTYMLLKSWDVPVEAFNWLPVITFSFVIFVAAIGIFTIPVIVLSEIMPEKVKDFCMSICMSLLWLFSFITIKYLPFMMDTIGFHGSMYIFAGVCVVCEIFIIFHVPETKGKNYDEIMDSLR